MLKLRFVVDGGREFAAAPLLVGRILDCECEAVTITTWKESGELRVHGTLSSGKLGRKLLWQVAEAITERARGLVALVDRDKGNEDKFGKLKTARKEAKAPFPVALGEAARHFEAWLLDDAAAVREGLDLPNGVEVPSVKGVDAKDTIDKLCAQSPKAGESRAHLMGAIAAHVDGNRCMNKDKTGFRAFEKDVRQELRPLLSA